MNVQVILLVSAIFTHAVCGSYDNQHHSYGYAGDYGYDDQRYYGPTAIPHVLHDGHIADTHDVAAAKAAHYVAVAKAKAHTGYSSHGGYYNVPHYGPVTRPVVLRSGYLADTHEVAAAKAAHYSAVAKAKAHSGYSSHGGYYNVPHYGPVTRPVVLRSGYLADTHDVAADKAAHYAAVAKAHSGYNSYGGYYNVPYYGPVARPVVLRSGYLADTHDVAAAKAAHHTAVATARAHSGNGGDYGYGESYGYGSGYGHGYVSAPYQGPLARPVLLKSGYSADTHEVSAAKAHHLQALHSAAVHHSYH